MDFKNRIINFADGIKEAIFLSMKKDKNVGVIAMHDLIQARIL